MTTATMWGGPHDGIQVDLVNGAHHANGRDLYPVNTTRGPIVFWAGQPTPGRTATGTMHIAEQDTGAPAALLALVHDAAGNPILCTHTTTRTPLPCGHTHLTATCTTLTPRSTP